MNEPIASVDAYLASLPTDRRATLEVVRNVIRENLAAGFAEGIQYGMIGYFVPHALYPPGYHANPKEPVPFLGLASQKSHMSLYLMGVYGQDAPRERFEKARTMAGKKLDMGKSCVRFKKVEDLALDVLADTLRGVSVEGFLAQYQTSIAASKGGSSSSVKKRK